MSRATPGRVHKPTNAETRAEGEKHVVAELQRRGFHHTLTPDGRRNDVSVGSTEHPITVHVRVTSQGQRRGWLVTDDLERQTSDSLVYAFVDRKPVPPETFLIPARVVSEALQKSHAAWLANPGRHGQPHTDSPMRMVRWDYGIPVEGFPAGWLEDYRERWDLLGTTSDQ